MSEASKPTETAAPTGAETQLLDTVRRLGKHRNGRRAIFFHLSRLKPYNRQPHHLRIAATALGGMIEACDGLLFRLDSGDLAVIGRDLPDAALEDATARLRFLFNEDPLIWNGEKEEFSTQYDLRSAYPALLRLAETLVKDGEQATPKPNGAVKVPTAHDCKPIDPNKLSAIENAISHADLSHLLQRQAICRLQANQLPEPLLHELYISIDGLRDAVLPNCDFEANPWLFQDLTRCLDRRMISILRHQDDGSLDEPLSLNLNIETLLSPCFMDLDASINLGRYRKVVVELQLVDVFANLASFAFARDFLHDRGYKICLDGTTSRSLPFIDRKRLGVDYVKLRWTSNLRDSFTDSQCADLRGRVQELSPERVILCRCDTAAALEVGHKLGIKLYQGYVLDGLLAEQPTDRSTELERMIDALARHRQQTQGQSRLQPRGRAGA